MSEAAAYQSLYRRFRPQRFEELLGQDHVVRAMRNAVKDNRVSHAYLFSGPRGTGKTSAARILAKALNCAGLHEGEPDNTCESCQQIARGSSLDVHELDAASNNGVDAMRELVSRAALGTPGRWKVYIVDEVHMLSTAASNALLKTLEEPPSGVVFVLATTDPQRVLPTIRSRTQHFEFRLLGPETLEQLVQRTIKDAELQVPDQAMQMVVRRGRGSARDALSALDQIAAAGIVDDECESMDEITEALIERDAGRALTSVGGAIKQGITPQRVATDLLEYLRNGFLALMARNLVDLTDDQAERVEDQARRLGPAALVRAMETLGDSLGAMRDTLEPRVELEVALVRLAKPDVDVDPSALLVRIEALEKRVAKGGSSSSVAGPQSAAMGQPDQPVSPVVSAPPPVGESARGPKASLGSLRKPASGPKSANGAQSGDEQQDVNNKQVSREGNSSEPKQSSESITAGPLDLATVEAHWNEKIHPALPQKAKARFRAGRITNVQDNSITFAFPNFAHKARCEEVQNDVAAVFAQHFARPITLILADDESSSATSAEPRNEGRSNDDDAVDVDDTVAAVDAQEFSAEARLKAAFPGSEEVG